MQEAGMNLMGFGKPQAFCLCFSGAVWSFVSASLCQSVPFFVRRLVSFARVSVSAPQFLLILDYCDTDFSQTTFIFWNQAEAQFKY